MNADEIRNTVNLLTWLKSTKSIEIAAPALSVRSMLRLFPMWSAPVKFTDTPSDFPRHGLPVFRACLNIVLLSLEYRGVTTGFYRGIQPYWELNRLALKEGPLHAFKRGAILVDVTSNIYISFVFGLDASFHYEIDFALLSEAITVSANHCGWDSVGDDAQELEQRSNLDEVKLWRHSPPDWFVASEREMREILSRDPETWDFWLRWWDGILTGKPLNWELQKAVALEIPEEAWSDPKTVAAHIREIEARFRVKDNENKAIGYLHAAIADYSFDSIDRVMRLVPFKEDIEHIRTPEKIAAFLADTDVLRDDLELYLRALAAEGGMQWAGFIKTYFQAILEELAQARQLQHLRVGRIISLGKKLETWSADDGVAKEFGPAIDGYREHLKDLRKVVNRHFAATLVRLAPLRDISSGEQDNHWHLLQDMQRGIKALAEPSGDLPPLAREDVEVLLAIVDGVEALLVRHDQLPKGDARSSLRREVDYQMALASVSVALFFERAQEQSGKADKVADVIEKQMKRGLTVGALWKLIRDTFLTP